MTALFWIIGFAWNLALFTPGMREKVFSPKYRFSFLKFCYSFNDFFIRKIGITDQPLILSCIRFVGPVLFLIVMSSVFGFEYKVLAVLGGSAMVEVIFYINEMRNQYMVAHSFYMDTED